MVPLQNLSSVSSGRIFSPVPFSGSYSTIGVHFLLLPGPLLPYHHTVAREEAQTLPEDPPPSLLPQLSRLLEIPCFCKILLK